MVSMLHCRAEHTIDAAADPEKSNDDQSRGTNRLLVHRHRNHGLSAFIVAAFVTAAAIVPALIVGNHSRSLPPLLPLLPQTVPARQGVPMVWRVARII